MIAESKYDGSRDGYCRNARMHRIKGKLFNLRANCRKVADFSDNITLLNNGLEHNAFNWNQLKEADKRSSVPMEATARLCHIFGRD